jgi:hypothetical protein
MLSKVGKYAKSNNSLLNFQLLLLGITIGTSICAARPDSRLVWSECWHSVRRLYDPSAEWSHPERMVVVASVLLVLAFISSGMNWFGRKKGAKCCPQFMASLGVMVNFWETIINSFLLLFSSLGHLLGCHHHTDAVANALAFHHPFHCRNPLVLPKGDESVNDHVGIHGVETVCTFLSFI